MKKILTMMLLLACTAVCWAAKGPTDEQLKTLCRDAGVAIRTAETDDARQQIFNAEAAKMSVDMMKITAEQVDLLFETGGMTLDHFIRRWIEPVLTAKADKETAFIFLLWRYMPENDGFMHGEKETAALLRFLNAKDVQSQLNDHPQYTQHILDALTTMKAANWQSEGFKEAILQFVQCKMTDTCVLDCVKAFNSAANAGCVPQESLDAIRKACIEQYKALKGSTDNQRRQKVCDEQIKYLEGPFACGTLVGSKAPELHFIRMFATEGDSIVSRPATTLSELISSPEAPVIMLDYWGTKCVPCIQSMPELAEMQEYFADRPVMIIGVTSLMGYFVDTPNHKTIQCRNNPEKELGCFPAYMKGMGINWVIGITEENVMNTDYGVLAIPHVTLIDRKGNVRYNAVNADKDEKIKLIEDLLKEE